MNRKLALNICIFALDIIGNLMIIATLLLAVTWYLSKATDNLRNAQIAGRWTIIAFLGAVTAGLSSRFIKRRFPDVRLPFAVRVGLSVLALFVAVRLITYLINR